MYIYCYVNFICVQNIFSICCGFKISYLLFIISFILFFPMQDSISLVKAQEEVDRVLQGRPPAYEDIKNLKFLTCCIMESLRLYPHPPVGCILSLPLKMNCKSKCFLTQKRKEYMGPFGLNLLLLKLKTENTVAK